MAKADDEIARPVTISLSNRDRDRIEEIRAQNSFRSLSDTIRSALQAFVHPPTPTAEARATAIEKTQLWINTPRAQLDAETFVVAVENLAVYCRDAFENKDHATLSRVAKRMGVSILGSRKINPKRTLGLKVGQDERDDRTKRSEQRKKFREQLGRYKGEGPSGEG